MDSLSLRLKIYAIPQIPLESLGYAVATPPLDHSGLGPRQILEVYSSYYWLSLDWRYLQNYEPNSWTLLAHCASPIPIKIKVLKIFRSCHRIHSLHFDSVAAYPVHCIPERLVYKLAKRNDVFSLILSMVIIIDIKWFTFVPKLAKSCCTDHLIDFPFHSGIIFTRWRSTIRL